MIRVFKFNFESSSRSRANSCKLMQVCWRGIALYAAMLLCSLYKFIRCGPLCNRTTLALKLFSLKIFRQISDNDGHGDRIIRFA
jgi:hypothetical protein